MSYNNSDDVKPMGHDVSLWSIFGVFAKIGAFTFGGGWAMISIIEREVVDKYRWIGHEEFIDLLALAQSLPGILAANISVAVGDRLRGRVGSIVAVLGTIMPSFLMILVIAIFLTPDLINNNPVLANIFKGIRPAVVALIIAPVISAAKTARLNWKTVWIPTAVALLIYSKWPVVSNPILWIILGGICGWLVLRHSLKIGKVNERTGKEGGEG